MFGIFAKTFMTATKSDHRVRWNAPSHWTKNEAAHPDDRFATRRRAEDEAHKTARRRY